MTIGDLLIYCGIMPNLDGYRYIKQIVEEADPTTFCQLRIIKDVYPTVAPTPSTNPLKVERAIRHAIGLAFNRAKLHNLNGLLGIPFIQASRSPTNSEFIALLVDKREHIYNLTFQAPFKDI